MNVVTLVRWTEAMDSVMVNCSVKRRAPVGANKLKRKITNIFTPIIISKQASKKGEAARKAQMGTLALAPNKRQCISHECETKTFS